MKRSELIARLLACAAVFAAIAVPLIAWWRTPLVHARMAEEGGWSPDAFKATVGEPLRLQITSDDVMHGFAVGKLDFPAVDVPPGKVTDVTLLFDKPGTYTFYCPRWCGINHWRMRGTIEVSGPGAAAAPVRPPLYVSLGIDLDAPRTSPDVPGASSLANIVARQFSNELAARESVAYYRSHSPYEVWRNLRRDPTSVGRSDAETWMRVAALWRSNTTPDALAQGRQLFAQNCAACHGEQGAADGVFSDDLVAAGRASMQGMTTDAMSTQAPADFTDPGRLLSASPALLQGKILRGGMGTGMPSWGPILTEEQIWNLVAYLYTFQFRYH